MIEGTLIAESLRVGGAMRVAGPGPRLTDATRNPRAARALSPGCQVNYTAGDLPAAAAGGTRRSQCCTEIFVVFTARCAPCRDSSAASPRLVSPTLAG
jgi:hypothetical protein